MGRKSKRPSRKKGLKYGPNKKAYEARCVWCERVFRASRPDAESCSPACKKATQRYVLRTGQKPPRLDDSPRLGGVK